MILNLSYLIRDDSKEILLSAKVDSPQGYRLLHLLKTSSALLDSVLEICFTPFGKRLYDYVMRSYLYYKKNNIGIDDKYATIENILK